MYVQQIYIIYNFSYWIHLDKFHLLKIPQFNRYKYR
jgi:hypothetical protein